VVLECDQHKPPQACPVFWLRPLTRRAMRPYRRYWSSDWIRKTHGEDADAAFAGMLEELATCLVRWERLYTPNGVAVPVPAKMDGPALECLGDALNDTEIWEIYYRGCRQLSEEARKNLQSRRSSTPDESAADAQDRTPVASGTSGSPSQGHTQEPLSPAPMDPAATTAGAPPAAAAG